MTTLLKISDELDRSKAMLGTERTEPQELEFVGVAERSLGNLVIFSNNVNDHGHITVAGECGVCLQVLPRRRIGFGEYTTFDGEQIVPPITSFGVA